MTRYEIASLFAQKQFIKRNFIYKKSLHWRYIVYRVARPCLKVVYKVYKLFHPTTPWTSQTSIRIFKVLLNKEMTGFEYGSGNSTIFFAQRLKHLTSIEHQQQWYEIVVKRMKALKISNVDYQFIPPEKSMAPIDDTLLQSLGSLEKDFHVRSEYQEYFTRIARYPHNHFDFILVDGRARVECAMLAIPRLKPGGIFVLDNSDRMRYRPIFHALRQWKMVNTTTGLFDTTFWFKPE